MLRLLLAVLLSGAASLLYQLAWTRALVGATSATSEAQATVLAVFMAGLGLGAALAGRRSARVRRPAAAYAILEVVAAGLAVLATPAIVASTGLADALRGPGDAGAWAMWVQLGLVSLGMLVPTTLLGASLPLVLEVVDRAGTAGRSVPTVGVLYGVNAAGAAGGCALGGFVTLERLGLFGTTALGAGLALLAACVALSLPHDAVRSAEVTEQLGRPLPRRWLVLAAASGFVGLGAEVAFARMLASVVYNTVYAFSEVLIGVLIGITAGGFLAAALARGRDARSVRDVAGRVQAAAAVFLALIPTAMIALASRTDLAMAIAGGTPVGAALVVLAIAVPMALTTAVLPLLVVVARGPHSARALGAVYAANTAGSVLGSVAIGFLVLPWLGLHAALALLVTSALVVAWALVGAGKGEVARQPSDTRALALCAVTSGLLLASYRIPLDTYRALLPEDHRILALEEGVSTDVMITDDASERRRLWINSAWVATAGGGTGYGHRVFGHFPALLHPAPREAMGIALGTGQTFAALLQHGVRRLDCVEINPGVIALTRRYFAMANGGLLDRPEVTVHLEDGRAYLRRTEARYDLLVLEPLQAWTAGTSSLYAREFYRDARAVIRPDGILLQWIPLYGQSAEDTRAMVATAAAEFPDVTLWLAGTEGILLARPQSSPVDPEVLQDRLRSRSLDDALSRSGVRTGADLLSHVVLGPSGVRAWTKDVAPITDDRPFLEFRAARGVDEVATDAIVASLAPYAEADDLSDYLTATSTRGAQLNAEALVVRAAMLAAWRVPYEERERRSAVLEAGLARAPGSARLAEYYRAYVESWLAELEAGAAPAAVLAQVRARRAAHLR